ncbi:hypothetical protein [Phenylobacterium sp.]|uniref:hypothetical protein n=1 Tax=Phenylobacterium sp. TaxID=1871053 RepID=UPI0035B3A5F8
MTDYKRHKAALQRLQTALSGPALVIHYSCESFYDYSKPASRRVTSIAVRRGDSSQTKSFSLHLVAEKLGVLDEIAANLDRCEREMLDEFYLFVKDHQRAYTWLHWNMRDSNYGFEAIAHRHEVLGGKPVELSDEQKLDLSPLLIDIYGKEYSGHPRIEWLVNQNNIHRTAFLTGAEEADAFAAGNFVAMHQSTLVKVQALSDIATLAAQQRLKTKSKLWRDVYGASVGSFGQAVAANWVFIVVVALAGLILGSLGAAPVVGQWLEHKPERATANAVPPAKGEGAVTK